MVVRAVWLAKSLVLVEGMIGTLSYGFWIGSLKRRKYFGVVDKGLRRYPYMESGLWLIFGSIFSILQGNTTLAYTWKRVWKTKAPLKVPCFFRTLL